MFKDLPVQLWLGKGIDVFMKTQSIFCMRDNKIIFLRVSGGFKKLVTATDVLDIADKNDLQITQALSTFVKQRKINFAQDQVTLVIPRSRVILRQMTFPSQKTDEIRSMIDLQVGNRIPFAKEEVEIDFQILSKTADGYAKVAVVIIPQEIALRYWNLFANAHLTVDRISISSVGLWLLYQQQMPVVENLGAIIDCEANSSEICLCRKSHWLTSREIAVGLVHIGNLGCAEILRQWELTRHHVTELSSTEVLKSVYLTTWAKGSSVLTEEMRTTYADLTVCEIDLSKVLSLARGVVWPKVIATENISLACVAGMALSPSLPSIDLVPKRIRLAQQRRLYQRQAIILGVWVLVALMALGSALGVGFFRKNVQLSALEAQYRSAKQEALEVEKQLEQVRDIQDRLKNHLIFTDLAVVLYRLLPSAMYLVNIAVSNDNVLSLEGVSATAAAINQFQKGMVDARYFSNVSLDYVNKRVTQQGEVDYFKITCTLKSNGQS